MFLIFRLLRHKPFQKYLAVAHLAPHERMLLLLNAVCQRWTLKAPLYLNKLFKFLKKATVKICKLIQGRTLGSHVVFHISMLSITKCISFPLFHVILSLLAGCVLLSDDEIVPARPVLRSRGCDGPQKVRWFFKWSAYNNAIFSITAML